MDRDAAIATSKFLSYVLRHQPEAIGLVLDAEGWADVEVLLECARLAGQVFSRHDLEQVVAGNDKQRFVLSPDGRRIRANQGHSVEVELQLPTIEPPAELFHGTALRFAVAIRAEGLKPGSRRHVHLSANEDTARAVGQRHGKPLVFRVASGAMARAGFDFFRSENGVWLTARVPPEYLEG
jgi:putative RNA 2'-phosphotransferase